MERRDVKGQHSGPNQKSKLLRTQFRTSYSPEEIERKLQDIGSLVGKGVLVTKAIRLTGIAESTYYRWRANLDCKNEIDLSKDMPEELVRIKSLQTENDRLRSALAELIIERQILKEVVFRKL